MEIDNIFIQEITNQQKLNYLKLEIRRGFHQTLHSIKKTCKLGLKIKILHKFFNPKVRKGYLHINSQIRVELFAFSEVQERQKKENHAYFVVIRIAPSPSAVISTNIAFSSTQKIVQRIHFDFNLALRATLKVHLSETIIKCRYYFWTLFHSCLTHATQQLLSVILSITKRKLTSFDRRSSDQKADCKLSNNK